MHGVDLSMFYQDMLGLLSMVITAFVGIGIAYLRKYVNSRIQSEELKQSIVLTLDTIESSTKAAISNLADSAKQALADGVITPEELKQLEQEARKEVEKNLTPAMKERLQAHVNDVDEFVQMKVKAAVNDMLVKAGSKNRQKHRNKGEVLT